MALTLNLNYIWVNTIFIALNYFFRLREKTEEKLREEQELKEINDEPQTKN